MPAQLPVRLSPVRFHLDPTKDPDTSNDLDTTKGSNNFRVYAMEHYDDLFEEFEFRCQRAAMMHYHEANRYDRKCCYLEFTAAILGAASVSGIGTYLVKWCSSGSGASSLTRSAGMLGLLGVLVASLVEIGAKGSTEMIPTLSKRCEGHTKAAVGWQRLTRLTRSYRIQLRNPALSVEDYVVWYTQLVQQRHEISGLALVPSSTYRAFNDPGRVFAMLSKKREMFVRYQEICEGKEDIDDVYDDD